MGLKNGVTGGKIHGNIMEDSWDIPWNIDPPEISSMAGNPWTFPANETTMLRDSQQVMELIALRYSW